MGEIDVETKVRCILDTAGLKVSDEELAVFVRMYPKIRALADSIYIPEIQYEEPALVFSASLARP